MTDSILELSEKEPRIAAAVLLAVEEKSVKEDLPMSLHWLNNTKNVLHDIENRNTNLS